MQLGGGVMGSDSDAKGTRAAEGASLQGVGAAAIGFGLGWIGWALDQARAAGCMVD